MKTLRGLATALLLAPAIGGPLAAQSSGSGPDSAGIRRAVQAEQARFERVRRNHLPWTTGGSSGSCDERIGRFCLTHGDGGAEWKAPPEHERITRARDRLLDALAEAARAIPGDGWVAGQRVRYLVEAGRLEEAAAGAGACAAERWWCAALGGFASHYSGEAGAADSLFSAAVSSMPPTERRRWMDLSLLLDPCIARSYRRMSTAEKERFERRFWRLADPFHTRPGNEARSEHMARQVWDRLQDRAVSTEGISWGEDLREILLRYGWPTGWERVVPGPVPAAQPSLVSHYSGSDRDLLPPCEVLRNASLAAGEWDREEPKQRTSYPLPARDSAIRWVDGMEYQVGVFRRGDSSLVVVAYQLPQDSFPAAQMVEAGVGLLGSFEEPVTAKSFPRGGLADAVVLEAPQGEMLLTIEALALDARRAARVRYGISVPRVLPGLLGLSDLLLLRSGDPLPDSLAAAAALVRGSSVVRPGERIGVYWEVYGTPEDRTEALSMSLRLVREGGSWLRGLARRIGLVDRVPPVRVRWQESSPGSARFSRSLAVRIPEELRPGRYSIELSLTTPGRESLEVRRTIEVRER